MVVVLVRRRRSYGSDGGSSAVSAVMVGGGGSVGAVVSGAVTQQGEARCAEHVPRDSVHLRYSASGLRF